MAGPLLVGRVSGRASRPGAAWADVGETAPIPVDSTDVGGGRDATSDPSSATSRTVPRRPSCQQDTQRLGPFPQERITLPRQTTDDTTLVPQHVLASALAGDVPTRQ